MDGLKYTLAGFLLAGTCACAGADVDTPRGAYQAFHLAVVDQDWDRAVSFLPAETVEEFRRVGRRLGETSGKPGDPLDIFLRSVRGRPVVPLQSIQVVSRGNRTAVLKVTAGPCRGEENQKQCSVSEVTLRRGDRGWVLEPEMPELLPGGG